MLVDNPLSSSFNFQPNFEDFFNMDLITGPSSGTASSTGGSSSRSSSSSPPHSFSTLPPTPPNPFSIPDPTVASYFNFLDDEFSSTKLDSLPPPPTTAAPFDFFAPFTASSSSPSLQSSSPHSAIPSESSPADSHSPLGIDPQLVGTPAHPKPPSEFDEDHDDDDDDEDLDDNDSPSALDNDLPAIPPLKVGGRGKAARKGTVQSGGIVKKSSAASTPAPERKDKYQSTGILATTSVEPDDWRPTPEEYKKMSSKEKRQLRNKISARNFRVRRKEYISTLEGDIAERDRLIDCIRTELMGTKSENVTLRQEIATLKKALLGGRGLATTPVLPPPAPLPEIPAAVLASPSSPSTKPVAPPTPKSPLVTPNTRKDLPTSPRLAPRNFWGGASGMGGFGGITPVHTTFIPEWSSVLSGKAQNAYPRNTSSALQENINPLLNGVTSTTLAGLGYLAQNQKKDANKDVGTPALNLNAFDSFADKNLFTLKSMEDFRMQLWTRMGQQQSQSRQLQQHLSQQALLQQSQPSQQPSSNGLASGIRPHYFSKQSPTLSAIVSGKPSASTSSYPTPPPSPPMRHALPLSSSSTNTHTPTPTEQQALLASIASQTLVRKLGSAFWDAFSGSSGSPLAGAGIKKEWDADKVRKVLEGKAVVKIVDVDPSPSPSSSAIQTSSSGVKESGAAVQVTPGMSLGVSAEKLCGKPVCFVALEEKLKNLHL